MVERQWIEHYAHKAPSAFKAVLRPILVVHSILVEVKGFEPLNPLSEIVYLVNKCLRPTRPNFHCSIISQLGGNTPNCTVRLFKTKDSFRNYLNNYVPVLPKKNDTQHGPWNFFHSQPPAKARNWTNLRRLFQRRVKDGGIRCTRNTVSCPTKLLSKQLLSPDSFKFHFYN